MMNLRIVTILGAMIIGHLSAVQVEAQLVAQTGKPVAEANLALQKFYERAGQNWVIRWSQDGKRVRSLTGREAQPGQAKGVERGREFLKVNAALFGFKPDLTDLNLLREHVSSAGQHIQLQQTYQGLPVEVWSWYRCCYKRADSTHEER